MFFRIKSVSGHRYLQIVENQWDDGRVRQKTIASLGRIDGALRDNRVLNDLQNSAQRLTRQGSVSSGLETTKSNARFDLAQYLPYRIERLSQTIGKGSGRYYQKHKLVTRDWRALVLLFSFGELTAAELVERGTVSKSGISRSVAKLTTKGLLEGVRDAQDTRRINLRLTAAGTTLVEKFLPYNLARQSRMLSALSQEEHRQLDGILTKLQNAVSTMASAPDGLGDAPSRAG